MKRRVTTSGKATKARSRKTNLKRRSAPAVARRRKSSDADLQERVRALTRELTEAREEQAATSEVLKVISKSPGDLEPVFQAMLENATRICEAKLGLMFRLENGIVRLVAMLGAPPAFVEFLQRGHRPGPNTAIVRAARTGRAIHVHDMRTEKGYLEGEPIMVAGADLAGMRTLLNVPMLKDREPIGAIGVYRTEVRPFTDKQIELVQNFAAQAVIAIENARLLSELRQRTDDLSESLEQQTATSEVLKVISSSPGELKAVFDAMLDNATRICGAELGTLELYKDNGFTQVAMHGAPPAYAEFRHRNPVIQPTAQSALGRLASSKRLVHV